MGLSLRESASRAFSSRWHMSCSRSIPVTRRHRVARILDHPGTCPIDCLRQPGAQAEDTTTPQGSRPAVKTLATRGSRGLGWAVVEEKGAAMEPLNVQD